MSLPASKLYIFNVAAGLGGYQILPETPGDFGPSLTDPTGTPWVSGIADLNGDGIPDIVIGSPGSPDKAVDAGRVFVAMGNSTGTAPFTLGDTLSQIIADGVATGDFAGTTVGSIGDMNGDGVSELLIGAPGMNRGTTIDPGAGFVVWGLPAAGGVDLGDPASAGGKGFVIRGEVALDRAGSAMAKTGDLNGDGKPDVLIGAPGNDAGGADAGAAYVVFGRSAITPVSLTTVAGGAPSAGGFKMKGAAAGDGAGTALASVGDMNGDGIADFLVGAPGSDAGGTDSGAAYVVFGKAATATVNLATVAAGTGGFRITGAAAGDRAGAALAGVGDVNGDGLPDMLIGSPGGDSAAVVFGKASTTEVNLANVAAGLGGGYVIIPENPGDLTDLAVAGGGDLNGDGILDLVIGASHNGEGGFDAGAVYVVWGGAGGVVDLSLVAAGIGGAKVVGESGRLAGSSVAIVGDMNGDGRADLVIGAPGASESVNVVFSDTTWAIDTTVYGTNSADTIGAGYGGFHKVGEGDDSISGLAGNDSITSGGGDDSIDAGAGADTVDAGLGNDSLDGGGGADALLGGDGDDTLTGADTATLTGGAGNDLYLVNTPGVSVVEDVVGGNDTVIASVDYTLGDNVEALTLTGSATHGTGNSGDNTITANAGNASLDGADGNDTLLGGAGGDSLIGGAGADSLAGGGGNDRYSVDNAGDVVAEAPGGGNDTIFAALDWTLGDNIEGLTLTGTVVSGTGNALDNHLTGNATANLLDGGLGDDTIDGAGGADTLTGGGGDDTYYVDNPADIVVEDALGGTDTVYVSGDWTLALNVENVIVTGTGPHALTGNDGNNRLVAGSGAATLDGGLGDDVEVGGEANDVLISGAGHDTLAGGAGNDRYMLHGGRAHIEDLLGHDTIDTSDATGDSYVDLSGDSLSHVEGEDIEIGQGGTTVLPLDVQFLQDLTGSFADDIANVRGLVPGIVAALQAVQSNSEFGASTFRDKAYGSFGNSGDWVYQQSIPLSTSAAALTASYSGMVTNGGNDLPEAQIEALMQLGLHATDVGFRAGSAHFVILFTDASFHMAGDGAAQGIATPNNGDAIMNGSPPGTGEDYPVIAQVKAAIEAANIIPIFAIAGGFEATYQGLVNDLGRGTVVTLTSNSSNVVAAITAGLTAATVTTIEDAVGGVGNDELRGNGSDNHLSGGDGRDTLSGATGNDTLTGGGGDDLLDGGAGIDRMEGGAGSDSYVVDNSADVVVELAGAGYDIVTSSVDFILPDNVERLTLTGTGNIAGTGGPTAATLYGNAGANLLTGGIGNDAIRAGAGNDTIVGGGGVDNLWGGTGADSFRFLAPADGHDNIMDFSTFPDSLEFSALGFGGGLIEGMNATTSGIFVAGVKATQARGQFIYNQAKGNLIWDADGTGSGKGIWLATFAGNPTLTAADIFVIH